MKSRRTLERSGTRSRGRRIRGTPKYQLPGRGVSDGREGGAHFHRIGPFRPHPPSCGRKAAAGEIQVREREEREHLRAVLGDAAIATLRHPMGHLWRRKACSILARASRAAIAHALASRESAAQLRLLLHRTVRRRRPPHGPWRRSRLPCCRKPPCSAWGSDCPSPSRREPCPSSHRRCARGQNTSRFVHFFIAASSRVAKFSWSLFARSLESAAPVCHDRRTGLRLYR
jgi:hypothetical protein